MNTTEISHVCEVYLHLLTEGNGSDKHCCSHGDRAGGSPCYDGLAECSTEASLGGAGGKEGMEKFAWVKQYIHVHVHVYDIGSTYMYVGLEVVCTDGGIC